MKRLTVLGLLVVIGAGHDVGCGTTDDPPGNNNNDTLERCGNHVAEGSEACDGSDLRSTGCTDHGYSGGALSCTGGCAFDFSQCTGAPLTCPTDDGFEENDTLVTAAPLTLPAQVEGIVCAQDSDYFQITADASDFIHVVLTFQQTVGDLELELLDAAGSIVDTSKGSGNVEEVLYQSMAGGVHAVRVFGFNAEEGPYSLAVELIAPGCGNGIIEAAEECEGADLSFAECTDWPQYVGGTLGCDNCQYDFAACQAPVCGNHLIEGNEACDGTAVFTDRCSDFPPYIGGTLGCAGCAFDFAACQAPVCGDGRIEGLEQCENGDFSIWSCYSLGFNGGSLTCDGTCLIDTTSCGAALTCPADDEWEENDSLATATPVTPPVATGGILCGSDDDYVSFTASASDVVQIRLVLQHSNGDLDLSLYDRDGVEVATSDGVTNVEAIEYRVPPDRDGSHVVQVYAIGGAENAYALDITVLTPVCGNDAAEPTEVCDGTDFRGLGCTDFMFTAGSLACADGCSHIDTSGCSGGPTSYAVTGSVAIVDDQYDGSLASMGCLTVAVPAGASAPLTGVAVDLGVNHEWVGDLVVKLESPTGTVLTLMSLPGTAETVDDGSWSGLGAYAELQAASPVRFRNGGATDAEHMGAADDGTVVCLGDGLCDYSSNPGAGPGTDLSDFNGESPVGNWRVCVGDSDYIFDGTLTSATLHLFQ